MILDILIESALRSLVLALTVGLGLWMTRTRGARLQTAAWTMVLAGALFMPLLMQWRAIEVHPPRRITANAPVVMQTFRESMPHVALPSTPATKHISWHSIGLGVYAAIATVLLMRLLTGLWLTWMLWRRARPVREPWAAALDVRESDTIGAPATFGSTILLPATWREWDGLKLNAVIAHERAHVAWGDFYVQLASKVHLAMFWFSPMGWWLENRLIHLAEAASDDAALETLADRSSYAEILLGLARKTRHAQSAVAMARPATVKHRVERILSGAILPANPNWKRSVPAVAAVMAVAVIVAGSSIRAQQAPGNPPAPAVAPEPPAAPEKDEVRNWWWSSEKHGEAYAIVSGDSLTMSGSEKDARRARSFRHQISGDYLWFEHAGKEYLITDPATVKHAKELLRSQEELGHEQAELGEQQARLGSEQALLGARQAEASTALTAHQADIRHLTDHLRDLAAKQPVLAKLEKELELAKSKELTQEQLGELQAKAAEAQSLFSKEFASQVAEAQSRLSELQSLLGELQSQASEKQSRLSHEQSLLGEQLSELAEQQSRAGEEQSRLAEQASRQLRQLLEECVRNGLARAAH